MDKVREALKYAETHAAISSFHMIRGDDKDTPSLRETIIHHLEEIKKKATEALSSLRSPESAVEAGWRPTFGPAKEGCRCRMCLRDAKDERGYPVLLSTFVVCPSCGNKRCPAASDHRFACTGSNESGQFGSVFGPEVAIRAPVDTGDQG